MNMIRLTREFSFEMAHFLPGYDGPCKNIHGHSFRFFVTVIGQAVDNNQNPKDGMVMDFQHLKDIVKKKIIDRYDHALLVKKGCFGEELYNYSAFSNIIEKNFQPTSENLIVEFAHILNDNLPAEVRLHSLKLYETEKSSVEWYRDDQ
ncbi:MAG: 6-pyruvoyl trahydropterin synthase family protein [Bacteroidales bacterium]